MPVARPPQLPLAQGARYSLDASALIDMKEHYPQAVFAGVWHAMGRVAEDGRLLVCEQVKAECRDDALQEFIGSHPQCVVELPTFLPQFAAFQASSGPLGILLTDPEDTRESADPFVVALALWAEGRDPAAIQRPMPDVSPCYVVSHEKGPLSPKRIPYACNQVALAHIRLPELLMREGYRG
jgi:hypothetical protein